MSDTAGVGTATVMFTDIVGSTEMRARLGEDVADVVRASHDEILTAAIQANDGRVVKHLGDGMMATFASAASGVASAVAIQQQLDLANRNRHDERVEVRIGLSIGDVTFDGDDLFGLPVVEAQRLEGSADPSTIRCAEMVMLMARGRGGHEFVALGDLDLKGLPDPLAACEIRWSPIADAEPEVAEVELGLPPVFAHGTGLPFAGRDDVFEQLVDAWKRCATGGFEVVLLAGEPGIGKTRLAQELAVRVHGGDGVVLGGRSDEDVSVPYQAFGAALDWFVRQTGPEGRLDALGEFPGDLVRLVPDLDRLVEGLPPALDDDAEVERYRLFQAVGSWLSVGGAERPRLLVLDDVHWADKPTLLLLKHVITNPPSGLMILCTYRDTDVDRTHPLSSMLADFRRMPAVSRIALDGLGDDGVRDLLVRTGGHDLDEIGLRFAELVQRETSGNPFFLGEVLRHLAETGALVERDGRWTSDLRPEEAGIPEGIREVVGRRLSRLGDDVEGVLRAAAVIGYEFDVDLLADVLGDDVDDVLDALDLAASANLVIEVGVDRHRFAHALVRETLHSELSSSRRARQHRKVAEALEARHADDLDSVITGLATHWAEASAGGDPTRAVELAIRASEVAVERGALENGIGWLEQALELLDDDRLRTHEARAVMVRLAMLQAVASDGPAGRANAIAVARAAFDADDIDMVCAALQVSERSSFSVDDGADPERTGLLRRALDLDGLTPFQRASLLGEFATELIFERDIAGRRAALRARSELLTQLPTAERAWLNRRPSDFNWRGVTHAQLQEWLGWLDDLDGDSLTPSDHVMAIGTRFFLGIGCADPGAVETAKADLLAAGDHHGKAWAFAKLMRSMAATVAGRIDEADRLARAAVESMRGVGMPEYSNYMSTTALANARELDAVARLDWLRAGTDGMGHAAGPSAAINAYIRFLAGDTDGVAAMLDAAHGAELTDDAGWAIVVAYWSEIVAAMGDARRAPWLLGEFEGMSGVQVATGGICLGAVDRLTALLHDTMGDHDTADELFVRAVAQHTELGSPPWVARTRLDWAASQLRRDPGADVGSHLDGARDAIGDLDLVESRRRLAELEARAEAR